MRLRVAVCGAAVLVVAAALAASATGTPGLLVGVDEDGFVWHSDAAAAAARDLGVTAVRITLPWDGAARSLSADDVARLDRAATVSAGLRVVVAIYGAHAVDAPQSDAKRGAFCSYAADVLQRYPTIRDIVVWNEVNLSYFWRPQFASDGSSAAPEAYEALLARCWDALHAVRADVNVISDISSRGNDNPRAPSNVSHSPGTFIAGLGAAYRASGRTRPLFDTFGHNPYSQSNEAPSRKHPGSTQVSQGDLAELLTDLDTAFAFTGQRVPGSCSGGSCPTVWYLEAGYQTQVTPGKASLYDGYETEPAAVPDGDGAGSTLDQGSQLRAGLSLAYCQPAVGAFFNFLLADEPGLEGWQSGVLWADWTRKLSYGAFRQTIAAVASRNIDCAAATTAPTPSAAGAASRFEPVAPGVAVSSAVPRAFLVSGGVLALAKRYVRVHLHLGNLSAVESYRSRVDPTWVLVDGFYRRRRTGTFALWLRLTNGWSVAASVRDGEIGRKRSDVPWDISRAFSRPPGP